MRSSKWKWRTISIASSLRRNWCHKTEFNPFCTQHTCICFNSTHSPHVLVRSAKRPRTFKYALKLATYNTAIQCPKRQYDLASEFACRRVRIRIGFSYALVNEFECVFGIYCATWIQPDRMCSVAWFCHFVRIFLIFVHFDTGAWPE